MSTAAQQTLIARWIESNPHKADAAEAWVQPRCVSVWSIIRQLELEGGNASAVSAVYELPLEAIEAAAAYYEQHKQEIDARIDDNRAFFGV